MCDVESLTGKILVGSISGVIVSISVYWMLRETWRMGREWISLDNLQLLLLLVYVGLVNLNNFLPKRSAAVFITVCFGYILAKLLLLFKLYQLYVLFKRETDRKFDLKKYAIVKWFHNTTIGLLTCCCLIFLGCLALDIFSAVSTALLAMCAYIILCEIIIFWFFFVLGYRIARQLLLIEASVFYSSIETKRILIKRIILENTKRITAIMVSFTVTSILMTVINFALPDIEKSHSHLCKDVYFTVMLDICFLSPFQLVCWLTYLINSIGWELRMFEKREQQEFEDSPDLETPFIGRSDTAAKSDNQKSDY